MAADFPATKKTFTQTVDGTDILQATLFNQPYDEIEAVQTFIGAMGRAQSYNTSMKALLKNYRAGCSVDYKGAADLYVRAGELYIGDASGNGAYRQNTSDTTVTWTNIDTSSEANSTVYYVYAVADSAATTFTVVISANATTPTGCTYYRLIGTFYNDASGNIQQVANLNRNAALGNTVTLADNTVYLAATDGFFVAVVTGGTDSDVTRAVGYTDSSNPPTTEMAACFTVVSPGQIAATAYSDKASFCMPVKKGDYFKGVKTSNGSGTDGTVLYYFKPLS